MKIALVIGNYDGKGGGAERWTDRFARWLLRRDHEVHLLARDFREAPEEATIHRIDVGTSPFSRRLRFAEEAEKALRRMRFDVVHDMGDGWHADVFMPHHGTRAAGFARNSALTPPAFRWCRKIVQDLAPRYREFQELERRQYAGRGTVYVALSRMVRRHMRRYYGVSDSSVRVVYNGVDTAHFHPAVDEERRRQTRRLYGFDRETVFLFIAHNFRLKGLDSLLAATAGLAKRNRVGLIVAGGDRQERYRKIARRLGVDSAVRFVGNQSDPRPIYQAADVYVQPTFYDPCSLVVLEALACGLPVVTTRHNGAGEIMTEGREGFVLDDPLNHVALAARMARLTEPDVRRDASESARALAERYSLERNCEAILDLYGRSSRDNRAA